LASDVLGRTFIGAGIGKGALEDQDQKRKAAGYSLSPIIK